MHLLYELYTISHWKLSAKLRDYMEDISILSLKKILVWHWRKEPKEITFPKVEENTGVNTIMVYLKYRQFSSSTPLVLNRLI